MNTYPNTNRPPRKPANKRLIRAGVIAAVAIVLALIVYSGCTAIVPTGYTGILTTFGKVADYTLDAGFHLKSPFQVVTVMDNREQKTSYNTQAFSSDIQQVQVIATDGKPGANRCTGAELWSAADKTGSNAGAEDAEPEQR